MEAPWATAHPCSSQAVPIGIHGDEVRYRAAGDKFLAVSFNFILQSETSSFPADSRFLSCVLRCNRVIKSVSLAPFWKLMAWSFRCLLEGKYPVAGPDGEPLVGTQRNRLAGHPIGRPGTTFALCEIRGDWQWYQQSLGLSAHWQAVSICIYCKTTKRTFGSCLSCATFEKRDPRRFTQDCITAAAAAQEGIPGIVGFHSDMIRICCMHTLNLGVGQVGNPRGAGSAKFLVYEMRLGICFCLLLP